MSDVPVHSLFLTTDIAAAFVGGSDPLGAAPSRSPSSRALWTLALASAAIAWPGPAAADDTQLWSAVFVNGPAKEDSRLLLWFDGHARFRGGGDELDVSILRPGLGWRVSPKVDVWGGYARVTTHRNGPDLQEDRLWQQATYQVTEVAGGRLTGRTRLEQRFRETGDDTGWRLRQTLRYARPIENTPLSLVVNNEAFVGLNDADWGQRSGFDQNRAFVGGAWQATRQLRIEAGYLNQHINGHGSAPDRTNHNASLSLNVSL